MGPGDVFDPMFLTPPSPHATDWRDVPLLTALSLGVSSVEADVWLVNETLYVSPPYYGQLTISNWAYRLDTLWPLSRPIVHSTHSMFDH